jgi:putative transposase
LTNDGRMKRARFTEEQIISVLREHETGPRRLSWLGSTESGCGGMFRGQALKALGEALAEQLLDAVSLRELLSKNGRARRQARGDRASEGRYGAFGTVRLLDRRRESEDGSLPFPPDRELRNPGPTPLIASRRQMAYNR